MNLTDLNQPMDRAPLLKLTVGDVVRIRASVVESSFLHWGRLACEWGVPVKKLKRIAGDLVKGK